MFCQNQSLNCRNQVLGIAFKKESSICSETMSGFFLGALHSFLTWHHAILTSYKSNNSYCRKITVSKIIKLFFQIFLLILFMGMFFFPHPVPKMLHIDKFRVCYLVGKAIFSFLLAASRSVWAKKKCYLFHIWGSVDFYFSKDKTFKLNG